MVEKCIKKNPRLLVFGLAVGGSSGTLPILLRENLRSFSRCNIWPFCLFL